MNKEDMIYDLLTKMDEKLDDFLINRRETCPFKKEKEKSFDKRWIILGAIIALLGIVPAWAAYLK